jgi:hypothetical protein
MLANNRSSQFQEFSMDYFSELLAVKHSQHYSVPESLDLSAFFHKAVFVPLPLADEVH